MNILTENPLFHSFVEEVKQKIKSAQYRALQTVNKEQISLYWEIGKLIAERQEQYSWGKSVVESLAQELQRAFVGVNGFSARNLWRMRSLYENYATSTIILPPLVAEIAWTHNIIILEKCKDEHQRFFYIKMARRNSWSKESLINAIEGKMYEKTVISQQNFQETLPPAQLDEAVFLLKDE